MRRNTTAAVLQRTAYRGFFDMQMVPLQSALPRAGSAAVEQDDRTRILLLLHGDTALRQQGARACQPLIDQPLLFEELLGYRLTLHPFSIDKIVQMGDRLLIEQIDHG